MDADVAGWIAIGAAVGALAAIVFPRVMAEQPSAVTTTADD